jgi:hypothetical protein
MKQAALFFPGNPGIQYQSQAKSHQILQLLSLTFAISQKGKYHKSVKDHIV